MSDLRNSPGLRIFQKLIDASYNVEFNDLYIPVVKYKKKNHLSIQISQKNIKKYKAIILLTDHDYINKSLVSKNAKLLIDTRNVFPSNSNVIYL